MLLGRRKYDDEAFIAVLDERLTALRKCQEHTANEVSLLKDEIRNQGEQSRAQQAMVYNMWRGAKISAMLAGFCVLIILVVIGEISLKQLVTSMFF